MEEFNFKGKPLSHWFDSVDNISLHSTEEEAKQIAMRVVARTAQLLLIRCTLKISLYLQF